MESTFLLPFHIFLRKYDLLFNQAHLLLNQLSMYHCYLKNRIERNSACDLNAIHNFVLPLADPKMVQHVYYLRSMLFDCLVEVRQLFKLYINFRDSALTTDCRAEGLKAMGNAMRMVHSCAFVLIDLFSFRRHFIHLESRFPLTTEFFLHLTNDCVSNKTIYDTQLEFERFISEVDCPYTFVAPRLAGSKPMIPSREIIEVFEIAFRRLVKSRVSRDRGERSFLPMVTWSATYLH